MLLISEWPDEISITIVYHKSFSLAKFLWKQNFLTSFSYSHKSYSENKSIFSRCTLHRLHSRLMLLHSSTATLQSSFHLRDTRSFKICQKFSIKEKSELVASHNFKEGVPQLKPLVFTRSNNPVSLNSSRTVPWNSIQTASLAII